MGAGAALSAVAGVGGSLFNTLYSMYRNRLTDERDDTAIQRRVKDLQAAGLNPLLAAGQGANTTLGMSTNLDTSGIGNFAQNLYDLKNSREMYKQNQLVTKLMELEYNDHRMSQDFNKLDYYSVFGKSPIGYGFSFDRLGNFKNMNMKLPGLVTDMSTGETTYDEPYKHSPAQYYIESLRNDNKFNYNQSLFNLKTQGYQNGLNLTMDTLQPLLQIGQLMTPTANFLNAIRGRKSYNYNQGDYNFNSRSYNENHNYRHNR